MRKTLAFFAALFLGSAVTSLAGAQETTGFQSLEEMQRLVTQMRTELFAPGALVPGWNRGGADPDAELRRAGPDRFYYLVQQSGGDAVAILTDRPLASFAPEGWRVVDTYGDSTTRLDNPVVQFEAMSDRYVIGLRADSTRLGDADCVEAIANATLYERPDAPRRDEDDTIPLYFRLVLLAGEGQTVCTRYDGSREAGWRGRAFLPDGRSLPQLDDAEDRLTIVPAAPVDRLITYRPRPAQGPAGT